MKIRKRLLCAFALITLVMLSSCTATENNTDTEKDTQTQAKTQTQALVPIRISANDVAKNPYMADSDNAVHNDSYSSDVTDAVLPIGIGSQLSTSIETLNKQAPSAAFYDSQQNMITPLLGGVAIVEMDGENIVRKGAFIPSQHDGGGYVVQISYSFVDSNDNVVMPTSHGHIIVVQTKDEKGEILPEFKKILDIDVAAQAKKLLGNNIDTNLLSIVYDYCGNLWFVTGGFRIYPDRNPAGFMGYISNEYIQKTMNGEKASIDDNIFVHKLADGEGAENGISSNEDGAVILTNKSCYMLEADNEVKVKWKVDYDSNGANDAQEGSEYTGGGLAYGSGTTPTLTKDLVIFTDNLDPINLIAISSKTGEVVAKTPVLDTLGDDVPVAVENSILVYSSGDGRTSVLVCNWFGAGNAGLAEPDADSSVQSYDNIYDSNWKNKGGKYIAPGVERVDFVQDGDSYKAEKVWLRDDIRDTSMIKLSTATGYLYGYWQNLDTDMWCYEVLDFSNGKTVYELPVSSLPQYNNMAVGMIADVRGNTLYCPTNDMEMVRWQDDFVYLPQSPAKKISLNDMERYNLSDSEFKELSKTELVPATYLMKANIYNVLQDNTIAFKVNGLNKRASEYKLFYQDEKGKLTDFNTEWSICDSQGNTVNCDTALSENQIYEIRFDFNDKSAIDIDSTENNVRLSIILAA